MRAVLVVTALIAGAALASGADRVLEAREAETQEATLASARASNAAGAASITKADDGHFWAEAAVDGVRVRFLVDTGATVVALTPTDAQRAGVDLDALIYDRPVNTAAGRVMAAAVTLAEVSVGGIAKRDIDALVVADGLKHSLLGMSYLGRLSRIEATRDALILRR